MIISEKRKFIFFHLPKTGGTSVNRALSKYYDHWPVLLEKIKKSGMTLTREEPNAAHFSSGKNKGAHIDGLFMEHLINIDEDYYAEMIDNYFTFSFTRNIYDWNYSVFLHREIHGNVGDISLGTEKQMYDEWIMLDRVRHPTDRFSTEKINFLGRTESLNAHFALLCEKLDLIADLRELNVRSKITQGYRYLNKQTPESIRLINERYKAEFELYCYPMLSPDDYRSHVDEIIDLPPIETRPTADWSSASGEPHLRV